MQEIDYEAVLSKVYEEIIDYPKLPLSTDLQNKILSVYGIRPTKRAADGATGWACDCGFVSSVDYKNCRCCGKPPAAELPLERDTDTNEAGSCRCVDPWEDRERPGWCLCGMPLRS